MLSINNFSALESERNLVGSLLNNPDLIGKIPSLKSEHFYNLKNRTLFETIIRQINNGITPDVVTIYEELKNDFEAIEIMDLSDTGAVHKSMIEQSSRNIIEQYRKRQIFISINERIKLLETETSDFVSNSIVSDIQDLEQTIDGGYKHISSGNQKFYEKLDTIYKKGKSMGLASK